MPKNEQYYLLIKREFDRITVWRTTDEHDDSKSEQLLETICGSDTEIIVSTNEATYMAGHDGDLRIKI